MLEISSEILCTIKGIRNIKAEVNVKKSNLSVL
jgi:hypothetical protein